MNKGKRVVRMHMDNAEVGNNYLIKSDDISIWFEGINQSKEQGYHMKPFNGTGFYRVPYGSELEIGTWKYTYVRPTQNNDVLVDSNGTRVSLDSMTGRVARVMRNPGLIDRMRNWVDDYLDKDRKQEGVDFREKLK